MLLYKLATQTVELFQQDVAQSVPAEFAGFMSCHWKWQFWCDQED